MTRGFLLALVLAACGDNMHRGPSEVCIVGESCPTDAGVLVDSAPLPACDGATPPTPLPCACGEWACVLSDGYVKVEELCGDLSHCDAVGH